MKKLESTMKNMVLVLTGTAIVTGGLLAVSNETTKDAIAAQAEKDKKVAVYQVLNTTEDATQISDPVNVQKDFGEGMVNFEVYHATDKDGNEKGTAVKSISGGFGGDLEIMVGFDADGKVTGYKVLKHAETPGLGAKAGEWFQKGQKGDIVGKDAGGLKVSKDGGEIDAITASTITSRAFLKAVNQAHDACFSKASDVKKDTSDVHTSASPQK